MAVASTFGLDAYLYSYYTINSARFTGDGSTTTFNLGFSIVVPTSLMVFVNGVYNNYNIDYTISVSGDTLTFTTAPIANAVVQVVQLGVPNLLSYVKGPVAQDLGVSSSTNTTVALSIQAQSYQNTPLFEWSTYSGTVLGTIDKNGKLGLGTSTPTTLLHVNTTGGSSSAYFTDGNSGMTFRHLSGNILDFNGNSGTIYTWHVSGNTNEVLRIANNGNIGILNSSPGYALDVLGGINTNNGYYFGNTASNVVASIKPNIANQWLQIQGNAAVTFIVNTTEVARFDASSCFLIGTTTELGSSAYKLQVNSAIFATSGVIQTSDERLKKEIEPVLDGLDLITDLNPVTFKFKDPKQDQRYQIGFLAQDVQRVVKDTKLLETLVHATEKTVSLPNADIDNVLALNMDGFIPLLVSSLKEIKETLDTLKDTVEDLNNRCDYLERYSTISHHNDGE